MSTTNTLTNNISPGLTIINELFNSEQSVTKRTVVPWYNPEQFLKVYDYLYSNDITKQQWAVDQIDVWKSKCHLTLPIAIEASQIITKSVIQDNIFTNQANMYQEKEIQLLYSTALIRFIDLTVELHQSYLELPLSEVAEKLGIPSWIVDLRNDATNSCLPSLSVLRMGAEAALKYLDKSYWSVESKNMKSMVKEPIDKELFKTVILAYQIKQFAITVTKNNKENYLLLVKDMKEILEKVAQCLQKNRKEFIDALCDKGALIMHNNDLKFLLNNSEYAKLINAVESKNGIPPELPAVLEQFWYPLLQILNKFGAIPELVETLLLIQEDRSFKEQWILGSWIIKMLKFSLNPMEGDSSLIVKLFQKQNPNFNWRRLLYTVVGNPSPYTPYVLPLINCHMRLENGSLESYDGSMATGLGQITELDTACLSEHSASTSGLLKSKKRQERKARNGKKMKLEKNI